MLQYKYNVKEFMISKPVLYGKLNGTLYTRERTKITISTQEKINSSRSIDQQARIKKKNPTSEKNGKMTGIRIHI